MILNLSAFCAALPQCANPGGTIHTNDNMIDTHWNWAMEWPCPQTVLRAYLSGIRRLLPGQRHSFPHLPLQNHTHTWLPTLYLHLYFLLMTSSPCPNVCLLPPCRQYISTCPSSISLNLSPAKTTPCPGHFRLLPFPHLGQALSLHTFIFTASPSFPMPFSKSGFTPHLNRWDLYQPYLDTPI